METKTFENVKVIWKGQKSALELPRGFYDFYIKDGVIAVICYASTEKKDIVSYTIYNPTEIRCIEIF